MVSSWLRHRVCLRWKSVLERPIDKVVRHGLLLGGSIRGVGHIDRVAEAMSHRISNRSRSIRLELRVGSQVLSAKERLQLLEEDEDNASLIITAQVFNRSLLDTLDIKSLVLSTLLG